MIDGGAFLGVNGTNGNGKNRDLISYLRGAGITTALCASYEAVYYSTFSGNAETLQICNSSEGGLVPMAVINPRNYESGGNYIRDYVKPNFPLICLLPKVQGWNIRSTVVQNILKDAEFYGLPVQFVIDSQNMLFDIAELSQKVNTNILIRWFGRGCYDLLSEFHATGLDCESLYFDVGAVTQTGGIEYLVDKIGSHRLFFATNAPECYAKPSLFLLANSSLSNKEREDIAHLTLSNLLNLGFNEDKGAGQELKNHFKLLSSKPKIDTHWHTGTWDIVEPKIGFEEIAQTQKKLNCISIVTSSVLGLNCDIERGNLETKKFINTYDHAFGYIVINPLDIDASFKEIDKHISDPKFVGFKTIQDFYGFSLENAEYDTILSRISGTGMPLLAHLPGMAGAAKKFSECHFIAAHSTWRYDDLLELPNVWLDLATSSAKAIDVKLEKFFSTVPIEKILFSSDSQLISPAWTLGKIAELDLSEKELECVFVSNAKRAFPRFPEGLGA